MNPRAIWTFIAGDSRRAPFAVAAGVLVVLVLSRGLGVHGPATGAAFVAILAAGLIASVFERA